MGKETITRKISSKFLGFLFHNRNAIFGRICQPNFAPRSVNSYGTARKFLQNTLYVLPQIGIPIQIDCKFFRKLSLSPWSRKKCRGRLIEVHKILRDSTQDFDENQGVRSWSRSFTCPCCISSFGATLAAPCVSQRKSERIADYLGGIHISPSSDLKLGFMSFDHVKLSAWVERDTWTNAIRKLHPLSVIALLLMPLCHFYSSLLVRKQPVDIKFQHFDRFVAMIF